MWSIDGITQQFAFLAMVDHHNDGYLFKWRLSWVFWCQLIAVRTMSEINTNYDVFQPIEMKKYFWSSHVTSSRIFVWTSHTKMMNSKTTKQATVSTQSVETFFALIIPTHHKKEKCVINSVSRIIQEKNRKSRFLDFFNKVGRFLR